MGGGECEGLNPNHLNTFSLVEFLSPRLIRLAMHFITVWSVFRKIIRVMTVGYLENSRREFSIFRLWSYNLDFGPVHGGVFMHRNWAEGRLIIASVEEIRNSN